jgi:hypothetical protein
MIRRTFREMHRDLLDASRYSSSLLEETVLEAKARELSLAAKARELKLSGLASPKLDVHMRESGAAPAKGPLVAVPSAPPARKKGAPPVRGGQSASRQLAEDAGTQAMQHTAMLAAAVAQHVATCGTLDELVLKLQRLDFIRSSQQLAGGLLVERWLKERSEEAAI